MLFPFMDAAARVRHVVIPMLDKSLEEAAASVFKELRKRPDCFCQPLRLEDHFQFRDMRPTALNPDHAGDRFVAVNMGRFSIRGISPEQVNLVVSRLKPEKAPCNRRRRARDASNRLIGYPSRPERIGMAVGVQNGFAGDVS